ncbi:uncharacterized protein LOC135705528 [Ochlerotatus camptorhynchus]|uniref:uncharacterized protein LOC135705528 n=1 Tax=Ochlerotatus camptorhynchus TaxID=644619 RepID=UPI0031D56B48
MAGQKFFHGLTEAMINRASDRPDRQKSSFYWPDEYMQDPEESYSTSSRRPSTASSVTTTPTQERASPASEYESAEVLKQRHRNNAQSHIAFSDGSDSSFSQIERDRQREKLRIEKFLREQSDDVSEMAKTRRQNTLKSSFQFYDTVDSGDTSPTKSTNGYHPPQTPDQGELATSRYSPVPTNGDRHRRQLSSPGGSSEYHYSARYTGSYDDFEDDRSFKSTDFNFSPPGTPGGGDVSEHRRNSHRHLRSSINFSNGVAVADDSSAPRKTVSVREAASTQRVGVGLPNL